MLEEEFGITVIFKKTQTLGDILLKKGRSIEKQYMYRKNIIYSIDIPCKDCPKKNVDQTLQLYNRNYEKKMQRTRKLVQKEI